MIKVLKKIKYYIRMILYYFRIYNPIKLNFIRESPDFLIIGAMKAGTTYTFNLLRQHHQMNLPKEKEIHYFDINYKYGKKWYNYQFPFKGIRKKISGEASPYYIYHPLAAKRAYQYNPNFKIIILLRNPVNRAISHFNMIKNHENLDIFPERLLIAKEEILIQERIEKIIIEKNQSLNRIHRTFSFIRRGLYLYQIKEWEKYFSRKNILIIKSENLYTNPNKEINRICDFLNISKIRNLDISVNKFEGVYKEKLNNNIIKGLSEFYKPYNQELEKYLRIKFYWD